MYCHFCENDERKRPGFATTAIHASQEPEKWTSMAVVTPIVNASTFRVTEVAPPKATEYFYSRLSNPTRSTLEECLATLEHGKRGFCYGSGMAATSTICSLLSRGDHILCCDDVYGGTNKLFRDVASRMGIDTTFADLTNLETASNAFQNNTRMVWMESPTNPMMKVIDIAGISKLAKQHKDVIVVVDNTFLTSYLQRPLDLGADIVAYSLTKYMNGHTDVIMGAAIVKDDALAQRLHMLQIYLGSIPGPFDCYLVNRSLKTLAVRMEQHKKSSLEIAQWLKKHPRVKTVNHPGLPDHPQREITKRQTKGHSGIFSFSHRGGLAESKKFLTSLRIFILAVSLGGHESLAELPYEMTHSNVPEKQRNELGITHALIRLSIGLECTQDLIDDMDQAFKSAFGDK